MKVPCGSKHVAMVSVMLQYKISNKDKFVYFVGLCHESVTDSARNVLYQKYTVRVTVEVSIL
jgi:hypothetical protein